MRGVSLGISGIFLVAMMPGILFSLFPTINTTSYELVIYNDAMQKSLKFLSSLGTAMLMTVIGVRSGLQIREDGIKKNIMYIGIGSIGVIINMLFLIPVAICDISVNRTVLYGIFSASMTSTPAFSVLMGHTGGEVNYRAFSLTYAGALFTMVAGMRLIAYFL